jgi:hypothetical protein
MSRPLRIEFSGALYHVTARGNRRESIFLDDGDRARFLDVLGEVETRDEAHKAFDRALVRFESKYPGAMERLRKDREELLAFYDFPAEHWVHIRTTNPIESTFSTVRLRTKRARNCGSRETTLAMVYKLLESAQKNWKRIKGFNLLTLVVNNVKFKDGVQVQDQSDRNAA